MNRRSSLAWFANRQASDTETFRMLFRLLLGFAAGMISTVTFHAAAWEALYSIHLMSAPPYSMALTKYGTPVLLSLSISRGLWGAAFGFAFPRTGLPAWLSGLLLGMACGGFEWLSAFAGNAHWTMTDSWALYLMQAILINACWVMGVGLIFWFSYRPIDNHARSR